MSILETAGFFLIDKGNETKIYDKIKKKILLSYPKDLQNQYRYISYTTYKIIYVQTKIIVI